MNGSLPDHHNWPRPGLLYSEAVRELHATIENDWDSVKQSACQTAAGRALWKHVVHDPLAELFAGETYLKNLYEKIKKDRLNNAREVSGVILAVRTLWFESKLEAAVKSFGGGGQVVLLGAGIIYYLPHSQAMGVLKTIADNCRITQTVLLADFMNKQSTTLSSSNFQFYSDWPDHLLPSLGFSDVKLSQIGDPDADYGLFHDPHNLFNKLRGLPRSIQNHPDDGTPCCRLYLVQASGSPNQTISRTSSS
ncbi:hypothetical protein E3N88_20863 [Mikania micrantha]|uniref:Uncharacterized protein n=1 Tax=Mikania micrantha TaxID=192012 RepID=A0A5N6NJX1_9ASTR|nr:hypothetical protein E3N88_20863 [Mikania micrantha]